jgi:hypothetical protein
VEEDGTREGEDDRSGDEAASFLVRVGSVGSAEDDEALVGFGLDVEDNGNEEGKRNERSEGAGERGQLSRAPVAAASEDGDDVRGFSRPSSRASSSAARSSTSTRRRHQTHMTPILRPRT